MKIEQTQNSKILLNTIYQIITDRKFVVAVLGSRGHDSPVDALHRAYE